ncbi:hypothetical protein [uncultured Methanobrevibacter sp.]|uniref:hypothetical protein n=1 Tax=uncultured Methanobrevibacter sp. TaxID=253161 RepID=UPI0025D9716A|nr:hypothetical protein [uncultured Methanobrevibacter sp.]
MKSKVIFLVLCVIIVLSSISSISATMNCIIISDPTGKDPNGAAAGSMSFEENMFESTFVMSTQNQFAILSGGESADNSLRLKMVCEALANVEDGGSASSAASVASSYSGMRAVVGGPNLGMAAGGSFDAYVITEEDDGSFSLSYRSGGLAVIPPGKKGAIFHIRDSPGAGGGASGSRKAIATEIAKELRDGYPATKIMGTVVEMTATQTGEVYGGGADNLYCGISTGDMFTPDELNERGYNMGDEYSKVCQDCGWSISFPSAEAYTVCPYCGAQMETVYAYEALENTITVSDDRANVFVYGSDEQGLSTTTSDVVQSEVSKNGYSSTNIASSINKAINNGIIVGVNHVEAKDININKNAKSVGVYYTELPNGRTSPPWNLPISNFVLNILGAIQTVIGIVIIILVIFRGRLLKSFQNRTTR